MYESSNAEVLAEQSKGWSIFHSHPPFLATAVHTSRIGAEAQVGQEAPMRRHVLAAHASGGRHREICNAHMTVDQTDPVQSPRLNNVSDAIAIMYTSSLPVILLKFDERGVYKQTAMAQDTLWKQCMC